MREAISGTKTISAAYEAAKSLVKTDKDEDTLDELVAEKFNFDLVKE